MVSFRGQKKAWATSRSVSFRVLIKILRRASPPLSYAESPPPPRDLGQIHQKSPVVKSSRVLFYLGEKFLGGQTTDIGFQGFHAS